MEDVLKCIKILWTLLILLMTSSCLFSSGYMGEEDKYVEMSVEQVIEELGTPDYRGNKVIDNDYLPCREIEPLYDRYFSQEELEKSVTINVAQWEKGRTRIYVWAKLVENEWIVFNSFKYRETPWHQF